MGACGSGKGGRFGGESATRRRAQPRRPRVVDAELRRRLSAPSIGVAVVGPPPTVEAPNWFGGSAATRPRVVAVAVGGGVLVGAVAAVAVAAVGAVGLHVLRQPRETRANRPSIDGRRTFWLFEFVCVFRALFRLRFKV